MPLRATAFFLSLLLHGFIAHAFWPHMQPDRLEALNLGEGQEIFLEPQGRELSEVTNIGDDLQSVETQAAVPIDQAAPPPPTLAPLEQPRDIPQPVDVGAMPDVAALAPQEVAPQDPVRSVPEQVRDVIAAEQSPVQQDLVEAREPPPEPIDEETLIAAHRAAAPVDLAAAPAAAEDVPADTLEDQQPQAVAAQKPAPPDEIDQPEIVEARTPGLPDRVREAELDTHAPSPFPTPLDEASPDLIDLVAEPDQVVLVMEQSSGVERTGGEASLVGLYLGEINRRIQRAKVNPRSQTTGTTVVTFTVGMDGTLLATDVLSSSGAAALDRAALASVERAAPFPPIPPEVSDAPMTFTQSFRFLVR